MYDKLTNRENQGPQAGTQPVALKKQRVEELSFVTHSFLSLHNLSKEMESINGGREEGKGSVFITAETGDYSRLLHSFHRKGGKQGSTCELGGSKQGLLPRIKQNVNR